MSTSGDFSLVELRDGTLLEEDRDDEEEEAEEPTDEPELDSSMGGQCTSLGGGGDGCRGADDWWSPWPGDDAWGRA